MDFEELTRKITDIKDKEMAMEFTQTIGKLLKENGVTVHCSECEQSIMTGGLLEIVFDKLDFTEHDKKFIDEIECWKKKCRDLSDYNKQLKYDLEKCENKKNENKELPFDPLEVVDMLINETYEHNIPFTGRKTESRKYGIDELEQIAEHLLVYCKHNNIECKFCNNKPKAIISSIKQKPDVIEMVTAGIEGGNTLTVLGILQSPYFVGVIPLEAEAKISYCPMCGRELSEV